MSDRDDGMGRRASDDRPRIPRSVHKILEHYAAELALARLQVEYDHRYQEPYYTDPDGGLA